MVMLNTHLFLSEAENQSHVFSNKGEGNGNPLHYSCLKQSHGQRSLTVYSPKGSQELGAIEWLSMRLFSN